MEEDLRQISGVGDATISALTERFSSRASLTGASISELQTVAYVSSELAIRVKAALCELPEPAAEIDKTTPRLAERLALSESHSNRILNRLGERETGRDSDVEKLVQHSLAVQQLPLGAYREAFRQHCNSLEKANSMPPSPPIDGFSDEAKQRGKERRQRRRRKQRRAQKMNAIEDFIPVFLDAEGPFSTKVDAIIGVQVTFDPVTPESISGYKFANHVDCSSGYASEFELVTVADQTVVLRKEYAAQRQVEKLETHQRNAALRRDGEACLRCGSGESLVAHHIIPIQSGGTDELSNIAILCESCHHEAHGGVASTAEVVYQPDSFSEWVNNSSQT